MKKFLALLLTLVMAISLVGCGGKTDEPAAPEAGAETGAPTFEKQTWKFACSATETSTWMQAAKFFGDKVSEATGGAVTVEYYAADQLTAGNQKDGIQALMDGTTELSMHSNLIYSGFDPRFNVVSLPFLFASTEDADAKLDGAGGDALKAVLKEKGLHCMGIAENGFRHITNSKHAIEALADMKGLKIRVAGSALLKDAFTAWGCDPAGANWSEVFTALQTGTYDGQENPLPTADAASIQEVQKYVTYWTGTYDCLFFCMNQEKYDSLTPELQAIVDDCGQQAVEYQRQINREQDQVILDKWAAAGVTVSKLTPEAAAEFKAATDPLYEKYAAELTPELISAFTGK
ncbi:MAG: DctP family TRAP transporter solute-binding subunit [Oscillospiraceae bacterium]